MPKPKKAPYRLTFEARPVEDRILCHRVHKNGRIKNSLTYRQHESPWLKVLAKDEQESWERAVKNMGW